MFNRAISLLSGIVIGLQAVQCQSVDKMDFEKYAPISTLVVPAHLVAKSKFPFIDVHNHQNGMGSGSLDGIVQEMDKLNMKG
jgi:hypothetical protein